MSSKISFRVSIAFAVSLLLSWVVLVLPAGALAQDTPNAYYSLRKAGSLLFVPDATVVKHTTVNEEALDFARQALKQPFDSPRLPSFDEWDGMARDLDTVTYEFVRESQFRAEQKDWLGAINARLDIIELAVKLEAVSSNYGNIVYASHTEPKAMENIYDLAVHLDGVSTQIIVDRLSMIEAQRPEYLDILERSKLNDLNHAGEILKKTSWKDILIKNSAYTMQSPEQGEMVIYGFGLDDLKDVTPTILLSQITQIWNTFIARVPHNYPSNGWNLNFKPNPAISVLISYPIEGYKISSDKTHAQELLLSTALQIKAIHQKTGAYPLTFKTPIDPFGNGNPLIYWPIGKTYRLYSVGPDGVDDGRRTSLSLFQARWPDDVIPPLLEPATASGMN